jgi:hypothetical protein
MIGTGNSFEAPSGVRGRVVYTGDSHEPAQHAYILAHPVWGEGGSDRHAFTDRLGEFALELAPGIYDVLISTPWNVPAARKIEVTPDGMMVFNGEMSVSGIGMEID